MATPPPTMHRSPGSPQAAVPPAPRFAALRHPDFAWLWGALVLSAAGGQMQQVAKAWLVLQRTDRPLALAALGLCYTLPTLALSATPTAASPPTGRSPRTAARAATA